MITTADIQRVMQDMLNAGTMGDLREIWKDADKPVKCVPDVQRFKDAMKEILK